MRRATLLCFAVLCLSPTASARDKGADQPQGFYFSADAAIDASGKATISNLKGAKGVLADALKAQLQARVYRPASLDGTAVESTTRIIAMAMLTPASDVDMNVVVGGITMAPMMRRVQPPSYPADMARHGLSGSALVTFTVDADGRPQSVRMLDVSDPRIEQPMTIAMKRWRFIPETIAGKPSNEVVAIPVWFYPADNPSRPPKFNCPPVGGRPHASADANGCMDRIEVTFHRY